MRCYRLILCLSIAVAAAAALVSCQPATLRSTTITPDSGLRSLQQAKYLKASFYAVMNYEFSGSSVTYPTLLRVPSVPIEWMGNIFSMTLEKGGPGQDATIVIHGSVTDDGAWIDNLTYSRQTVDNTTTMRTTVLFKVGLRNVPLTISPPGADQIATFNKTGSDLRKHIESVEYVQGTMSGSTINISAVCRSVDWGNALTGQQPVLSLSFEAVASESLTDMPVRGGVMGMN